MYGIDRTHKAARALAELKVPAWVLGNVPRQLLLVDSAVGLMSKQTLLKIWSQTRTTTDECPEISKSGVNDCDILSFLFIAPQAFGKLET